MAAQAVFPKNDHVTEDKAGRVFRTFEVHLPTASEAHECLLGERGIFTAAQISGPGTITFTAPSGTDQTAAISVQLGDSNTTDTDQTKRVTMNPTVAGTYRVLVEHGGRNASAL